MNSSVKVIQKLKGRLIRAVGSASKEGVQEALCSASMQAQNISVVETEYEEVQNA